MKEGEVKEFFFLPDGGAKIIEVSPGCGSCTKAWMEDGVLKVKFTADPIPKHLIGDGRVEQEVTKNIRVDYDDSTYETLSFTAKIVQK